MTYSRLGAQAVRIGNPPAAPYVPGPQAFTGVGAAAHAGPASFSVGSGYIPGPQALTGAGAGAAKSPTMALSTLSGNAPAAPADVTAGVPASMLIGYGTGHATQQLANYTTWKGWGFGGYTTKIGGNHFLVGFGGTQQYKTAGGAIGAGGHIISAVGDTSGPYDYQQAYEGYGVPTINGGAYGNFMNIGGFQAKAQGLTTKMYIAVKLLAQAATSTRAPFGDWFDDTLWASVCAAMGNVAAGAAFLGGDGIKFDMENNTNSFDQAATSGHTNADQLVKIEQRGYEFAKAIYQAFPNCEVLLYDWPMPHSWYDEVLKRNQINGGNPAATLKNSLTDNKTQFIYGLLRAMTQFGGAQSKFWHIDSFWYRGSTQYGSVQTSVPFALKWNTYGGLSNMTQTLPTATLNGAYTRFYMTPFSWAGIDGNNAIGQQGSPAWENSQDVNRLWGMGGLRAEYNFNGTPGSQSTAPDPAHTPPITGSIWYPGNDYSTPANRTTRLFAAASTTSQDSTPPTISSVTQSGRSGSNITLTFNVAHGYGIHYVDYAVYSNPTTVVSTGVFVMTFDPNGATQGSANLDSARMLISQSIVAAAGRFVVITAHSTIGQSHSVVVSV